VYEHRFKLPANLWIFVQILITQGLRKQGRLGYANVNNLFNLHIINESYISDLCRNKQR
jgi:hypothetical protein